MLEIAAVNNLRFGWFVTEVIENVECHGKRNRCLLEDCFIGLRNLFVFLIAMFVFLDCFRTICVGLCDCIVISDYIVCILIRLPTFESNTTITLKMNVLWTKYLDQGLESGIEGTLLKKDPITLISNRLFIWN